MALAGEEPSNVALVTALLSAVPRWAEPEVVAGTLDPAVSELLSFR